MAEIKRQRMCDLQPASDVEDYDIMVVSGPTRADVEHKVEFGVISETILGRVPKELPSVTSADNAKVLTVTSSGTWMAEAIPSQLPTVTSSDSGKILGVTSQGSWAAENAPKELPTVTSADSGKVLGVSSQGAWNVASIPSELPTVSSADAGNVLKVNAEGSWVAADPGTITVDDALSTASTNPVQNKVITETLAGDYMTKNNPTGWGTLSTTANDMQHDGGYNIIWGLNSTVTATESSIFGTGHQVTTAESCNITGLNHTVAARYSNVNGHMNIVTPEANNTETFLTDVDMQGWQNIAQLDNVHVEGYRSSAVATAPIQAYNEGQGSHVEGFNNRLRKMSTAALQGNHVEGHANMVDGVEAGGHVEGAQNELTGQFTYSNRGTHIEGLGNIFSSTAAPHIYEGTHIEGVQNSLGSTSLSPFTDRGMHIEGYSNNINIPGGSLISPYAGNHVEGVSNTINAQMHATHIEGYSSTLSAPTTACHIEGAGHTITGNPSDPVKTTHIEGLNNVAPNAINCHIEGEGCMVAQYATNQHVQGKYNTPDNNKAFIIGNGTANNARSNAFTVDWNGAAELQGDLTVHYGGTAYNVGACLSTASGGGGSSHSYSTSEQSVGTWIDGSTVYERTVVSSPMPYGSTVQEIADITDWNLGVVVSFAPIIQQGFGYASDYVYLATGTTASGANAPALVYIKHKYVGDDIHQVIYASPMTAEFEAGIIVVTIRYTKASNN